MAPRKVKLRNLAGMDSGKFSSLLAHPQSRLIWVLAVGSVDETWFRLFAM